MSVSTEGIARPGQLAETLPEDYFTYVPGVGNPTPTATFPATRPIL
jgi:hypothetical protein